MRKWKRAVGLAGEGVQEVGIRRTYSEDGPVNMKGKRDKQSCS